MNNTVKRAFFGMVAMSGLLAATPAKADHVSFGLGIGAGAGNFFSFGMNNGGHGHGGAYGHYEGYGRGYVMRPACPPAVVYAPPPVVYAAPRVVYVPAPPPVVVQSGYWQEREERTWIEGNWVETFDAYGRRCKMWQPGRWEIRRIREWVQQ
ncbi:MAG: hypothetical protein WCK89_17710 [bacterium]